ncbi:hypothetical protein CRENBAI_001232 [Crenichthys baileyi]|uniref:Solute carrier family 15 member 5 n=1 Tax=Crenichthys baileyi TaxID=28760 RepID=A0AAV9SFK5_9TELE
MAAGELKTVLNGRGVFQTPLLDQKPRKKSRKKLQVVICVLLVELCERFTFFGIVCNMILFCTVKLGYDNYLAATVNLCFIGTSTLTPVLVGWFAETYLGSTKVLYLCAFLHFFGTAMLPVVAFPFEDFYIDTHHMTHKLDPMEQQVLFYLGLLAAVLGIGGIRAILCPMGAYSLQSYNQHQLLSFFNWFYWLVNLNSTVVFLGIAYIQESVAQNLGFLIPFTSLIPPTGGISLHFLTLSYGGGCLLGAFIIQLVYFCSGGNFYPNSLHDGNLERFFFLLALLMTINTLLFWRLSYRYMDLSVQGKPLNSSSLSEKLLHYKATLRFYDTIEHLSTDSVL